MEPISFTTGLIGLVLFIVALVSIVKSDNHGLIGKLLWIAVAFFLPILGAVLWFAFGRGRVRR